MKKLPAGEYYIGDPCYVINGSDWDEFLGPFWALDNHGGIFDFEGHPVCAFYTKYGDGCFEASNGALLSVDAGMIGAVPMELVKGGDMTLGTEVYFNEPFECVRDYDGRLHFGDFSVMTGDEDEYDDGGY